MGENFLSNDRIPSSFFLYLRRWKFVKKIILLQLDSLLRDLYYREIVNNDALAGILSDKTKINLLCCSHNENPAAYEASKTCMYGSSSLGIGLSHLAASLQNRSQWKVKKTVIFMD